MIDTGKDLAKRLKTADITIFEEVFQQVWIGNRHNTDDMRGAYLLKTETTFV